MRNKDVKKVQKKMQKKDVEKRREKKTQKKLQLLQITPNYQPITPDYHWLLPITPDYLNSLRLGVMEYANKYFTN